MTFIAAVEEFKETLGITGEKPSFSKRERETIYAVAFGKYDIGAYKDAADFFTQLILHDPYDPRFWKGLAASCQMQKEYQASLHAWAVHALLSGHSTTSHFHAAECYLSMGEIEEAKKALKMAEMHINEADSLTKRVEYLKEHLYG